MYIARDGGREAFTVQNFQSRFGVKKHPTATALSHCF